MENHLEHRVMLDDKSEHPNLYKWSLTEVGEPLARVKQGQLPWGWSLYFQLSDIGHHTSLSLDPYAEDGEELVRSRETISAKLLSSGDAWDRTQYSMFGTQRHIEDVTLTIHPAPDGHAEECRAFGIVSYTAEHDFRDVTTDDTMGFELVVSRERFRALAAQLDAGAVGGGTLRVDSVSGFYSDWSPSISTNLVKVLTDDRYHPVELPEGCEIVPPRLGKVGKWDLSISGVIVQPTAPSPAEDLDEDNEPSPGVPRSITTFDPRLLAVLKSVRLAIWVVAVLLVLLLFK